MANRLVDIMSEALVVVSPTSSAALARRSADERRVHHLIVLELEQLAGMICRCDLDFAFEGDSVARHMRAPCVALATNASLGDAALLMLEHGLGCLPLLDAFGRPRGLVTREALQRVGALPSERGVDCFAACGANHCSLSTDCPGTPVFCCDCLDQVREKGARELYFTLGGGD
jgi:CBS-domain-containing membrane protein